MFQMQNDQKQTKNEQSLHNWQFQSPNFQSFTKLVPKRLFQMKSQPKFFKVKRSQKRSLGKKISKMNKFGPGIS